MSLEDLHDIKPIYFLPKDNLIGEVLIPAFRETEKIDCMMGFFSSGSLAALAPGLATFINCSEGNLRLIVSPFLNTPDRNAIEAGLKSREEIVEEIFSGMLISEDELQKHTLKCLTYLIYKGRLEIKIALIKNAIFHPKVWLFYHLDNILGVHGSSNMTGAGIQRNFEQISVVQSWQDSNQNHISLILNKQFQHLWDEVEDDCIVLPISQAIKENLLKEYLTEKPPTEDKYLKIYKKFEKSFISEESCTYTKPEFKIPSWLKYQEGTFAHQGKAVEAWFKAGGRGVLEMATGSGKTITAMICAYKIFNTNKPLLIVIAAPYIPLIEQWCGEIEIFGLQPINLTKVSGATNRSRELQKIHRRLKLDLSEVEAVVVSHDTLCSNDFHVAVAKLDCNKMLIADEMHNLGRKEFINNTPDFFNYRLGLSATPERQYDQEGTDALFDFFGPTVFQFTLQEAIGKCLVKYDYYVHPVYLTAEEMDEWYELTFKIKKNSWHLDNGHPDDFLAKLFRDRRKLLETARNKIYELKKLIELEDKKQLRYTLIYATDKDPKQLRDINALLLEAGILFHQLTDEETRQKEKCQKIIKNFQNGQTQVLTAKRVLDEGVNIPQINKAFILASTTVKRQWIQRRGRLLRTCKETGKTHSEIHDFISLPLGYDHIALDKDAKNLIKSELQRVQEFASAARNAGRVDGPLSVITEMAEAILS